jgi:hypothetical protein
MELIPDLNVSFKTVAVRRNNAPDRTKKAPRQDRVRRFLGPISAARDGVA